MTEIAQKLNPEKGTSPGTSNWVRFGLLGRWREALNQLDRMRGADYVRLT